MVLGCSVCKQEVGSLAVCCVVVEAVFIVYMFCVLSSNTSWYRQLYYLYVVCVLVVVVAAV